MAPVEERAVILGTLKGLRDVPNTHTVMVQGTTPVCAGKLSEDGTRVTLTGEEFFSNWYMFPSGVLPQEVYELRGFWTRYTDNKFAMRRNDVLATLRGSAPPKTCVRLVIYTEDPSGQASYEEAGQPYIRALRDVFGGPSYNVVSIGGGIGPDLCGVREWLSTDYASQPPRDVEYRLFDRVSIVEHTANALGFTYVRGDLQNPEALAGAVDENTRAVIMSHVVYGYLSNIKLGPQGQRIEQELTALTVSAKQEKLLELLAQLFRLMCRHSPVAVLIVDQFDTSNPYECGQGWEQKLAAKAGPQPEFVYRNYRVDSSGFLASVFVRDKSG